MILYRANLDQMVAQRYLAAKNLTEAKRCPLALLIISSVSRVRKNVSERFLQLWLNSSELSKKVLTDQ